MKHLIALLALVACNCAPGFVVAHDGAHEAHLAALKPEEVLAGLPGLDGYTLRIVDCGFMNAFTEPSEHEILMCADVSQYGLGFERAVLLHEAGHAAFRSGVRFTGMEELAADEYAVYWSIRSGRREDVRAFADFWASLHDFTDDGQDAHPDGDRRASYAWCLYLGSGPAPTSIWTIEHWYECRAEWARVKAYWDSELPVAGHVPHFPA